MRKNRLRLGAALAAVVLLCPLAGVSTAAVAAEFFHGKVVKLVVGYGPGGGFDTLARLIAPHLERKIGATVVVENQPGGGGLVALGKAVRTRPDGLTLMLVNGPAAALAQLLDLEGPDFDLLNVTWLGRVTAERSVVLVNPNSGFASLADLKGASAPVKWAAGGKADIMGDTAACVSESLGLNSRIIIGYKGSKEASLATMRGETDGIVLTASSARKSAKGGRLRPLAVLARSRSPELPDLPTVFELTRLTDTEAWWLDYRAGIAGIGRALLAAPGIPADRAAVLSASFAEILTDPAFIADARAKGRTVSHLPPNDLRGLVESALGSLDEARLSRVRHVVLEKYYR